MSADRAYDLARARLIVALDLPDADAALAAASRLRGHVGLIKVGLELFVAEGPAVVRRLREACPELPIFLDLKLHDIPNTMRGAVRAARRLDVRFLTVHAGSGASHLRVCVDEAAGALGILAVTVLTSQDEAACREAGHTRAPAELVELRAAAAAAAGCEGIVCSGEELERVRAAAPALAPVIPGIRPATADRGDQQRIITPAQAIARGARYLVVGRPILSAPDPVAAADAIVAEIAAAL
ncbi:MAG: orotidine-5'-phosphate decarboxylase [Nannocystis sp.]|nr:orotidine-5'-phosphate decarboxylase [Nannocystis sp.]